MLIGIAGKARVGKDTLAEYLEKEYLLTRYAFAEPMKRALSIAFDLNERHLSGDLKEVTHPLYGVSPREMMQKFGTDYARKMICDDVWLKRAELFIDNMSKQKFYHGTVISDVRFENEAQWIRKQGGYIIHIERPGAPKVNEHSSEAGVSKASLDFTILNNDRVDQLYRAGCYFVDLVRRGKVK